MMLTSKEIGNLGEAYAVHYLRLHGYTVRERNYRAGRYEIDIVATTLRDIAFVEVKTRTCDPDRLDTAIPPKHAVNADKQYFTRRAAGRYLYEHPTKKRPRMDVLEIWLAPTEGKRKPKVLRVNHIKAAY